LKNNYSQRQEGEGVSGMNYLWRELLMGMVIFHGTQANISKHYLKNNQKVNKKK